MYRTPPVGSPLLISAVGGVVVAYERTSGRRVWRFEATQRGAEWGASLCHVEDQRVICVSMTVVKSMWSNDGIAEINCLEYLTGRPLWRQEVLSGVNVSFCASTVLVEGGQVLVAHNAALFAFALETGALQWQQPIEGVTAPSFVTPVSLAVPGRAVQADQR